MTATPLLAGPEAKARYGTAQEFFLARWLELAAGEDNFTLSRPHVLLRQIGDWSLMGCPGRTQIREGGIGPWEEVDGVTLRIFDLVRNQVSMAVVTHDFSTNYSREKLELLLFGETAQAHAAFGGFLRRDGRWRNYPREEVLGKLTAKTRALVAPEEREA